MERLRQPQILDPSHRLEIARIEGGVMRSLRHVLLVALLALVGVLVSAGGANAAAPKALINASTVSGSPSQEEAIATTAGFAVTVVSDATWGAMTASDFGQYDLLIAGDPTCGSLPPGLVSSASVYGPVVLGLAGGRTSAGNRIVVGTDPVFHDGGDYTSPGARGTIIREGIAYAGSHPGTTGMYFDATCSDGFGAAGTLAILTAISAGGPAWTIDGTPPCGGSVSLIASDLSFPDLTTASLQGWGCSVHESFPTFPTEWTALAVATDTASHPTCGVDPHTGLNACGEAYILITSGVVHSLVISVSPLEVTNPVGTSHTVTANVHEVGGTPPVAGQLVTFTVTGQNAGASGTCLPADCKSDVNGNVSFTYFDGAGAGDDTIKASFTDAAGSLQTATAQKHWMSGPVTHTLSVTKAGSGSGTVTSSPAGIDCGSTCSASFLEGTMVTLTATPVANSTFTGWSGACSGTGTCTVTMDQDRAVTATFDLVNHTLTVTKAGTGSGTVTSNPTGIDCGPTCSAMFSHGTVVTLTATPVANSTFTGWSGACSGTGTCTVTMDQDRAVTATFALVGPPPPRVLKQGALASLQSLLPTGDKREDKKLEDAIEHLQKSLDPDLWLDDSHLTEQGEKVFHEEKHAVDKLRQIKNPPPTVTIVMDTLVAADEVLARTAIDEAITAGGDPHKLAEAEKEMDKASKEIAKGHLAQAIEHYGHAWKKAQEAVK
jgi:hypothetical protein